MKQKLPKKLQCNLQFGTHDILDTFWTLTAHKLKSCKSGSTCPWSKTSARLKTLIYSEGILGIKRNIKSVEFVRSLTPDLNSLNISIYSIGNCEMSNKNHVLS